MSDLINSLAIYTAHDNCLVRITADKGVILTAQIISGPLRGATAAAATNHFIIIPDSRHIGCVLISSDRPAIY